MNSDIQYLPLYSFFQTIRSQKGSNMGLSEYIDLLDILQKDLSYFENPIKLFELCKLLWFKPGYSEVQFLNLFKQSVGSMIAEEQKKEEEPPRSDNEPEEREKNINDIPEERSAPKETLEEKREDVIKEDGELFLNIVKRGNGAIMQTQDDEDLITSNNFRFTDFFPGINARRVNQIWKFLQNPYQEGDTDIFDISATIEEYVNTGYLHKIQFQKKQKNKVNLLTLVDRSGSMVAFDQLERILLTGTSDLYPFNNQVYYYNSLPKKLQSDGNTSRLVYQDMARTKHIDLLKLLAPFRFNAKGLSILIFSDVGAGQGYYSLKRIDNTIEWINELRKATSRIAWLNPYPEDRWENSTASAIAEYLPMFEATESGLKKAVDIFRGK